MFMCRDKKWLSQCHKERLKQVCRKSCGACSSRNKVQVLVTGNLASTEIRQPNQDPIITTFDSEVTKWL